MSKTVKHSLIGLASLVAVFLLLGAAFGYNEYDVSWILTAHYGATDDFQKAFAKWR